MKREVKTDKDTSPEAEELAKRWAKQRAVRRLDLKTVVGGVRAPFAGWISEPAVK